MGEHKGHDLWPLISKPGWTWCRTCQVEFEDEPGPVVGKISQAITLTPTAQDVKIEVTSIEQEVRSGWYVWGYRQYPRRSRIRHTAFPRRYFVPKGE